MKKVVSLILILGLFISGCSVPMKDTENDCTTKKSTAGSESENLSPVETDAYEDQYSVTDIENMNEPGESRITYNSEKTQVTSIEGKYSEIAVEDEEDALNVLQGIHGVIGIETPKEELSACVVHSDEYGAEYTFSQIYNGYEVYGCRVTVSADKAGITDSLSSGLCASDVLHVAPATPSLTQSDAEDIVKNKYGDGCEIDASRTRIVYYALNEYENDPILAYLVYAGGTDREGMYFEDSVIIHAETGTIVRTYTEIRGGFDATGVGETELGQTVSFPLVSSPDNESLLYMTDPERNIVMYDYSGGSRERITGQSWNDWNDKTVVSAFTNVIKTYDWYKETLGRDGIDGKGGEINVCVHYNHPKKLNNAFWDHYSLVFCENSDEFTELNTHAAALDVAAHEYTHGVVDSVVGKWFPYENMTGAINEGYADIIGCLVQGDWEIAEDRKTIRNIAKPWKYFNPSRVNGWFYNEWVEHPDEDSNDRGWVHKNSTIISHSAYLMFEGGLSRDTLAKLWYKSLSMGYDAKSTFQTVRANVIKAARKIGLTQSEIQIVRAAFDQVDISEIQEKLTIDIVDYSGRRLSGAVISISDWTWIPYLHMNPDAPFSVHIAPGSYTVSIGLEGYEDYTENVVIMEEEEVTIKAVMHGKREGKCGDNLTWKLDNDGVLSISGSGNLWDYTIHFESNLSPWYEFRHEIREVILGEEITSIGSCAFYGCLNLRSVTMPNSINYIRNAAFGKCVSLTDIFFDGTVTEWNGISVNEGNDDLLRTTKHFAAVPEELLHADVYSLVSVEDTDGGWNCEVEAYQYYTVSEGEVKKLKTGDIFSIPEAGNCVVSSGGMEAGYVYLQQENGGREFEIYRSNESKDWRIREVYWGDMMHSLGETVLFVPYSAKLINNMMLLNEPVNSPRKLGYYYEDESGAVYSEAPVLVEIIIRDGIVLSISSLFMP